MEEEDVRSQVYHRTGEFMYFWLRQFYAKFYTQLAPGVTGNQLFVLVSIGRQGRLTVSELAEELGVSLSAITGLSDRLARQGLVVRQRAENDRRLVYVELTAEGKRMTEDFLQQHKQLIARYFDRLPLARLQQVAGALDELITIVQDDEF